ncbi:MAG TPA: PKD domain containing protein, partial [Edaphobacter sp.]|nr:PKD domain containing protein [Edaphobacter sp.]
MSIRIRHLLIIAVITASLQAQQMRPVQSPPILRQERQGTAPPPAQIFKVFQFPADKIPRIDGDPSDWNIVPESYSISLDQMHDDEHKHAAPDSKDLDVHVKVGWVKGLNRLYFLYEAYDNFWDFADPGLHNDTFEIVVDGDRSGGPLIPQFRNNADQDEYDAHFSMHGVHAQNYHIFTPSEGKDWALAWGCQP